MAKPSDRLNFPECPGCPYVEYGSWSICSACASEQLVAINDPCPICSQECNGKSCINDLCQDPDARHIDKIDAITLNLPPLREVMHRYKYMDKAGWAPIFARLLVGHLETHWQLDRDDIVIPNPPNPDRDHIRQVFQIATDHYSAGKNIFDSPEDPTITKDRETVKSAGRSLTVKKEAAKQHAEALILRHPDRIKGKRVVIYDDICTTGHQLNEVARRMKQEWGARKVYGIVLARHPWEQ